MSRLRLAIVTSHVIQYQDPFFRLLAQEPSLEVEVLFCSEEGAKVYHDVEMGTSLRWDLELLQGYAHRFLRNRGRGDAFFHLVNAGLPAAIARGRYDAVLFMTGWAWASSWLGFAACRFLRVPFLLFGDSSFVPEGRSLRASARATVLRALFGLTSGFLISGAFNADYYRHYGADPRRFFPMPWAIDNDRFSTSGRFAPGEREALRARYGIAPDRFVILFSAKLIERKDPRTLLAAYAAMRHRDRAALVFMGDGVLRPELERLVREQRIPEVHFLGFINQTEIPKHYAMSDVFVLPSLFEPRGSVVNEAMACGLPVVITDRCGPAGDIVREGDNGFIVHPGDGAALTERLDRLAGDDALRRRMGQRSREILEPWSYATGVRGVAAAVRYAKERPA